MAGNRHDDENVRTSVADHSIKISNELIERVKYLQKRLPDQTREEKNTILNLLMRLEIKVPINLTNYWPKEIRKLFQAIDDFVTPIVDKFGVYPNREEYEAIKKLYWEAVYLDDKEGNKS